jgi:WD40 repeat protein
MKLTLSHDHKLPTGVLGLAFSADLSRAFASCFDGAIYAVDMQSGTSEPFQGKHTSYASGCVLLPDGKTLISAGYDGTLLWHDVDTLTSWRRVKAHAFWSWQMALSPDGTRVATTTGQYIPGSWKYEPAPDTEPSVKVFDTRTGDLVAAFGHTPPVLSCAFTPDGRHLAAANMMGEVRVWTLPSTPGAGAKPVSQWTSPDFTSWGTIKTHHYCGGIYGLAFAPDASSLLCCGMGPMGDPMAGNGKMTWQRWAWEKAERVAQIKDNQQGSGLMESVDWMADGTHFVMAGRQAQGTWNAAIFAAADGNLVTSLDTKKRITHARFSADGKTLLVAGAQGQGARKQGEWPAWGRVQSYKVEA